MMTFLYGRIMVLSFYIYILMFAGVTIGFTVSGKTTNEATGSVTLEVSLVSGTLQRSVTIGFTTMENTSGKIATSGIS